MTEKQLKSLLKYSSNKEILIVTHYNRLIILVCPFKVITKYEIGNLFMGQVVLVEEIKITQDMITVFIIETFPYYYYHFEIVV